MYGGLKGIINLLSKEEILKRVSQEDIYKLIFEDVQLGTYYTNPTREDTRAGSFFKWYNGTLWFYDFADTKPVRDCFELVKDYYNINFYQVLEHLNSEFKLGLCDKDSIPLSSPTIILKTHTKVESSTSTHISFKSKTFDKFHKSLWQQYEISSKNLEEDDIHAVLWFRMWSKTTQDWVVVRPQEEETTFAICEWSDATKICRARPLNNNSKWITDCTKNHIGGLKKLPFAGNTLIITKSYKDWRVLTNQGLNVIYFQNEGMFPSKDKLEALCCTFEKIIIWFDNDDAGINAASKLHQLISSFHRNVKHVYLPLPMLLVGIKDPADCVHKDKQYLNQFLKQQIL